MLINKFPNLQSNSFFKTKVGLVFSILVTQYLVFLTWIAFRVRDIDDLLYSLEKYVILDFAIEKTSEVVLTHKFEIFIIILFFILHFISYRKQNLAEKISNYNHLKWFAILLVATILILFFFDGNPQDFIYFEF